jgi:2-amino-4-hydroxy-6-hydroxymethyldihydropteridine diphosphokinase
LSAPERRGYLGLGSNLGDRRAHLRAAIAELRAAGVVVDAVSSLYETAPVGEYEGSQPDFLNAVVAVRTDLEPERLLDLCKLIERERGRIVGGPRHGPRPLDVDILLLGDLTVDLPRLAIPHAAISERRFVLEPLLELDPSAALPDGTGLAGVLAGLTDQRVERVGRLGEA